MEKEGHGRGCGQSRTCILTLRASRRLSTLSSARHLRPTSMCTTCSPPPPIASTRMLELVRGQGQSSGSHEGEGVGCAQYLLAAKAHRFQVVLESRV